MLTEHLTSLVVFSRNELILKIQNILGKKLDRIIDTHNTSSVILIYKDNDIKLLLKTEFGNATATHAEISWYKRTKQYQSNLGVEYIDSYTGNNYALLLLRYVEDSQTIDELILDATIDSSLVTSYIQKALDIDRELFNETSVDASSAQIEQFYLTKYQRRRQESGKISFLHKLFSKSSIIINGNEYLSPDAVIKKIKTTPNLLNRLTPTKLGFIHGDLHCGNILIKGHDMFLIDPNGNPMMPLEYDIGKILHSVHGNYGSIMREDYVLHDIGSSSYVFELERPEVYDIAFANLRTFISEDELLRSFYAEMLHFATLLPHHASNEKEATALFLRCVQLGNSLLKYCQN